MAIKLETLLDPEVENLAELLDETQLGNIGMRVCESFREDLESRAGWQKQVSEGLKLALQVTEEKDFPWEKASNVKFPLITVAALQYSARAYPALVPDVNVVKTRIVGEPTDEKIKRADRVSKHMSYQILEEDEDWEPEMDRLLVAQPIVGTAFKKTYFDPDKGHNCSQLVLAQDLVVDYWAKSLETAERVTHRYHKRKNEVMEYRRTGFYLDIDLGKAMKFTDEARDVKDQAQGTQPGAEEPTREILECHMWLDLDEDDYDEPYVVYVDRSSSKVVRINRRFEVDEVLLTDGDVAKITPNQHFTKYGFIPSPDGGFYDLGFGHLLGPLSQSIDTTINQLIDAGTLSNMQSGFLGRGVKLKSGSARFQPGEWKRANASGDDLRKNILPLPVRDPSQVLFQLLGLLIEYAERISSVSDMMAGQTPGQNTPATTSMAVLEQGMAVFSGIFKRTHRCMRDEFRKLYRLNQIYLNPTSDYYYEDAVQQVLQADYSDPFEIKPASDPKMASDMQKAIQAEAIVARAYAVPGYNTYKAERRYLEAMRVEDIEEIFPDPQGPNAIPQQPSIEALELQLDEEKAQVDAIDKQVGRYLEANAQMFENMKRQAEVLKLIADAEAAEAGPQLEAYKAEMQTLEAQQQNLMKIVEMANSNEQSERDRMASVENSSGN